MLIAAVVAIAGLAYAALARWRLRALGPSLGVVIAAFFVGAWFLLDARWQWNLLRQANITRVQYAGKSWRERHLAAEDGPLFAFIEKVRADLPPPPARVFMVADTHYFRGRGAYHLYPYNVYFDPWRNTMPPPSAVRPGDFFVVYHRQVAAELLFADSGAALFRIR